MKNDPYLSRYSRPHIKKGRYANFPDERMHSVLWPSLKAYIRSLFIPENPDLNAWQSYCVPQRTSIAPIITWLGHSTFLIQIGGFNILTDPIFGSPSRFLKRLLPVGIAPDMLPPIDLILISHNHRDHMDVPSLRLLADHPRVTVMVPMGDKSLMHTVGFERVVECTWWQSRSFERADAEHMPLTCTFTPAHHWSQRGLFDRNKSLWGSWIIEWAGTKIYFAGDTARGSHLKKIGEFAGAIDVALMPIGPCEPRSMMKHAHISPEQVCDAIVDLRARHIIPMHWGTFRFGVDRFMAPIERLRVAWNSHVAAKQQAQLHILKTGQQFELPLVHSEIMPQKYTHISL